MLQIVCHFLVVIQLLQSFWAVFINPQRHLTAYDNWLLGLCCANAALLTTLGILSLKLEKRCVSQDYTKNRETELSSRFNSDLS